MTASKYNWYTKFSQSCLIILHYNALTRSSHANTHLSSSSGTISSASRPVSSSAHSPSPYSTRTISSLPSLSPHPVEYGSSKGKITFFPSSLNSAIVFAIYPCLSHSATHSDTIYYELHAGKLSIISPLVATSQIVNLQAEWGLKLITAQCPVNQKKSFSQGWVLHQNQRCLDLCFTWRSLGNVCTTQPLLYPLQQLIYVSYQLIVLIVYILCIVNADLKYNKCTTIQYQQMRRCKYPFTLRGNASKYPFTSLIRGNAFSTPITIPLNRLFQQIVECNPSSILLHSYSQGISLSYSQMHAKASSIAYALIHEFHLRPLDRIGIYSYNKWQWVAVQLAAAMAGLILVNINPAYYTDELDYTIAKVGLRLLFISDQYKHMDYVDIVSRCKQPLPYVVCMGARKSPHLSIESLCSYPQLRTLVQMDEHSPANIQFTSGTTGRPKAATLSHYNILNNAYLVGERCGLGANDNLCVPVPFYHCFGMILGFLAAMVRKGAITVVGEGFSAEQTIAAIEKYQCSGVHGVPTMFTQYLRVLGERDKGDKGGVESLRTGIVAGSLCSEALMSKIYSVMNVRDITNCYGMTETSPVSFQTCPTDSIVEKTTTVGRILEGLEAKIVDGEGRVVEVGKSGELMVKGWSVMLGYWGGQRGNTTNQNTTNQNTNTTHVLDRSCIVDGWMKTGDLAQMNAEGYLSIVGRLKDMIIRGGENIYPKEIQEYISKMEGVVDVQVVGVTDEKFGEEVAAVIRCNPSTVITKADIFNFCLNKIAYYKIPKYVKFVTSIPLTVSGKPMKYQIRAELEQEKSTKQILQYVVK